MTKYIIKPAPQTGIGWFSVQRYSDRNQRYEHVGTFRGETAAQDFIDIVTAREAARATQQLND
jgi:hypothetical protein